MMQINLLPWREQARQEKRVEFMIIFGAAIAATLFLLLIVHFYLTGLMSKENKQIAFLQEYLSQQQTAYNDLTSKLKTQAIISDRLAYLNQLDEKNFIMVHILTDLTQSVPATVTLNQLSRKGDHLIIQGVARSELDVTQFIKKLSKSIYFNNPQLTKMTSAQDTIPSGQLFLIDVDIKNEVVS